MPPTMAYLEPNDKNRQDPADTSSATERQQRTEKYKTSLKYYRGQQLEQLDKKEGEPDDNTIINVVKMTIDRTMSFLFPKMPELELDPKETELTEDERWLRDAWAFNGGVIFLQGVAMNGCLTGHNYIRVLPPKRATDLFPRLINLDPSAIISYWMADDVDTVVWHEIYWSVAGATGIATEFMLDVINDEENNKWRLQQFTRSNGARWEPVPERSQDWNFPWGPIIHWQHLPNPNHFYGYSETEHLKLQDSINLGVSENSRINRYHSSPKTVGTGLKPDEIKETAIDDLWVTENDAAKIYNLEMRSEQQFAQQHVGFLYDSYLAENRVVLLRGEVKDFQRVTNAGVRTVFMDMLSKNVILRQGYGSGVMASSQRMGLVGNRGDALVPTVLHHDPLPTDDAELANIATLERGMNIVSRETISQKRGYVWEDERERMTKESQLDFLAPQGPSQVERPTKDLTNKQE